MLQPLLGSGHTAFAARAPSSGGKLAPGSHRLRRSGGSDARALEQRGQQSCCDSSSGAPRAVFVLGSCGIVVTRCSRRRRGPSSAPHLRRGRGGGQRVRRGAAEGLPFEGKYDGAAIDAYFGARPLRAVARLAEVSSSLYTARDLWEDGSLPLSERGTRMRSKIGALGPVFVKIAQTLATRSDIVSQDLGRELGMLQDAMKTFDDSVARQMIREEFSDWPGPIVADSDTEGGGHGSNGKVPLFAELSAAPVAAASLAQVYKGSLGDGTSVAVKVQRPGLAEKVGLDFYVLRLILAGVNTAVGITRSTKVVQSVLDEVGDGLFAELDFTQEGEHIERFKQLYGAKCPDVHVPEVVWDRTRPRILTMTWLSGRKPRELNPQEKLLLVSRAAPCLSLQLMDAGFIHCDPHEGNMMLLEDGSLGLIDFGLVAQMTPVHQESMASAILNLLSGDYKALEACFVGMGVLNAELGDLRRPGTDQPFADALEDALTAKDGQERRVQGAGLDRRRAFGQLYEELSGLAFRYYFTLPSYYVLVMRSFVTLEGIAFAADPDFNMYRNSYPFAFRRMLTPRTALGRQLLRDALLQSGRFKVFSLFEERGQKRRSDGGVAAEQATTAMRVTAEVLLAAEGRELRRVLAGADSAGLVADLAAPSAAPLRRAAARAAADRCLELLLPRRSRGASGDSEGGNRGVDSPSPSAPSEVAAAGAEAETTGAAPAAAFAGRASRRRRRRRRLVVRLMARHLRRAGWRKSSWLALASAAHLLTAVARGLAARASGRRGGRRP